MKLLNTDWVEYQKLVNPPSFSELRTALHSSGSVEVQVGKHTGHFFPTVLEYLDKGACVIFTGVFHLRFGLGTQREKSTAMSVEFDFVGGKKPYKTIVYVHRDWLE